MVPRLSWLVFPVLDHVEIVLMKQVSLDKITATTVTTNPKEQVESMVPAFSHRAFVPSDTFEQEGKWRGKTGTVQLKEIDILLNASGGEIHTGGEKVYGEQHQHYGGDDRKLSHSLPLVMHDHEGNGNWLLFPDPTFLTYLRLDGRFEPVLILNNLIRFPSVKEVITRLLCW